MGEAEGIMHSTDRQWRQQCELETDWHAEALQQGDLRSKVCGNGYTAAGS